MSGRANLSTSAGGYGTAGTTMPSCAIVRRRPISIRASCIISIIRANISRSEAEAEEKRQVLQSLVHPDVGRQRLSTELGIDLQPFSVDEPLPYQLIDVTGNAQRTKLVEWARNNKMTIRELYLWYAGGRGQ